MSSLVLYGHPFSSYTHKVLIALYENATPFEFRTLAPEAPHHIAEFHHRWPLGKFPLLVDADRTLVETSIIIEHLHLHHPGPVPLLPPDPQLALEVRFLDRFFDLYIMTPVQTAVAAAITGDPHKRQEALDLTAKNLETAYTWLETHLPATHHTATHLTATHLTDTPWAIPAAGFTLADCAAAPSLFYADWVHPISDDAYPNLRAYRTRLLARPSFARAINEARPFRHLFPLGAPDRD